MRSILLVVPCLLIGCGGTDPCSHFEPYQDVVSGRIRTTNNGEFLDAMALYRSRNYLEAVPLLTAHVERNDHEPLPRLYLASAHLATGKPFDAELQLDLIERDDHDQFKDQVEWYRALCHACSGQFERARSSVRVILTKPRHTFSEQAQELLDDLPE